MSGYKGAKNASGTTESPESGNVGDTKGWI
jgi:hypothetical protein